MEEKKLSGLKLFLSENQDFLNAVGKVTVQFSKLESELSGFIVLLLDHEDPDVGNIVTAELSFKQLIQLLMSLFRHRISDPTKTSTMLKLLKKCRGLELERNRVVHSYWTASAAFDVARRRKFTAKFKRGYNREFKSVPIREIRKLASEIQDATSEIGRLSLQWYDNNIGAG